MGWRPARSRSRPGYAVLRGASSVRRAARSPVGLTPVRRPRLRVHNSLRRRDPEAACGGCLRGSSPGSTGVAHPRSSKSAPHPVPEAAFKVGESSVEIGAHYFQKRLELEPHLRASSWKPSARLLSSRMPEQARRSTRRGRARSIRLPPVPSFQPIAVGLRIRALRTNVGAGSRCSMAIASIDCAREQAPSSRVVVGTRMAARDHGALVGRRRQRTRGLLEAAARTPSPEHARRQRLLVARQLARASRRLVGRPGVAGARPVRAALAEHQPPDGRRLLGLADSARLRQHERRHRRRRRHAPVPSHQPVRARAGLAARVRAAVRRGGAKRTRRQLEDFLALQHFAHGCARVFSPDRWALRRRSRRVHRPVLLARLGLHRHAATTTSPT